MMQAIKDHPQTFAMIAALFMVLATLAALSYLGKDYNEGPVVITLAGAVNTICGAIAGKAIPNLLKKPENGPENEPPGK